MAYITQIRLRRDLSSSWVHRNPILASGEPGFESDTGKMKIGDGGTPWVELGYFVPFAPDGGMNLPEHINSETPHPVYDNGPSLFLLYENAKV